MKLWLISQTENNHYDTYDSAVVVAETEEQARSIHPSGDDPAPVYNDWASVEHIKVKLLGEAIDELLPGVICASFNAG